MSFLHQLGVMLHTSLAFHGFPKASNMQGIGKGIGKQKESPRAHLIFASKIAHAALTAGHSTPFPSPAVHP